MLNLTFTGKPRPTDGLFPYYILARPDGRRNENTPALIRPQRRRHYLQYCHQSRRGQNYNITISPPPSSSSRDVAACRARERGEPIRCRATTVFGPPTPRSRVTTAATEPPPPHTRFNRRRFRFGVESVGNFLRKTVFFFFFCFWFFSPITHCGRREPRRCTRSKRFQADYSGYCDMSFAKSLQFEDFTWLYARITDDEHRSGFN